MGRACRQLVKHMYEPTNCFWASETCQSAFNGALKLISSLGETRYARPVFAHLARSKTNQKEYFDYPF